MQLLDLNFYILYWSLYSSLCYCCFFFSCLPGFEHSINKHCNYYNTHSLCKLYSIIVCKVYILVCRLHYVTAAWTSPGVWTPALESPVPDSACHPTAPTPLCYGDEFAPGPSGRGLARPVGRRGGMERSLQRQSYSPVRDVTTRAKCYKICFYKPHCSPVVVRMATDYWTILLTHSAVITIAVWYIDLTLSDILVGIV